MKTSVFTAIKIYENVALLKIEVNQLETALKELRNNKTVAWESNIQNDTRLPVKLLYDQLIEKRKQLDKYANTKFVMYGDLNTPMRLSDQPEDYKNW